MNTRRTIQTNYVNVLETCSCFYERVEKLTLREMEAIIRDTNYPCHQLVPVAPSHGYSTKTKENNSNVGYIKSRTEKRSHHLCLAQFLTDFVSPLYFST